MQENSRKQVLFTSTFGLRKWISHHGPKYYKNAIYPTVGGELCIRPKTDKSPPWLTQGKELQI
jgi:hypothetical protein